MTSATWFQFHVVKTDGTTAAESVIIESVGDEAMEELTALFLVAAHKPIRAQEVMVPGRAVIGHD